MQKFWQFLPFLVLAPFAMWLGVRYGTPTIIGIFTGIALAFAILRADGVPFWWLMDLAKKIGDQGGSTLSSTPYPKRRDDR